jgi:hypothetical protein
VTTPVSRIVTPARINADQPSGIVTRNRTPPRQCRESSRRQAGPTTPSHDHHGRPARRRDSSPSNRLESSRATDPATPMSRIVTATSRPPRQRHESSHGPLPARSISETIRDGSAGHSPRPPPRRFQTGPPATAHGHHRDDSRRVRRPQPTATTETILDGSAGHSPRPPPRRFETSLNRPPRRRRPVSRARCDTLSSGFLHDHSTTRPSTTSGHQLASLGDRGVVLPCVPPGRTPHVQARAAAHLLQQRLPSTRLPIPASKRPSHDRHLESPV